MKTVIELLCTSHHRPITILGVMLIAIGLNAPTGIITLMVSTYSVNVTYLSLFIIIGVFVKVMANGNIPLRLIGILPYTIFVGLALSLWVSGATGLLQSQILYVILWALLAEPLIQDIGLLIIKRRGE